MSTNQIQRGENLDVTAPYALSSGDGALVNTHLFGVAAADYDNGAEAVLFTEGVFTLPKESTDVITVGLPLYWDDSSKVVTIDDDSGSRPQIGVATSAAGNPSSSVNVKLTPVVYV